MTSNSLNFSSVTGGNSYNPKYAKFSWNATWDNANRRWNIAWNLSAQGGLNSTAYCQAKGATVTLAASSGTASGAGTTTQSTVVNAYNDTILINGSFTLAPTAAGAAAFTVTGSAQFWTTGDSFGTSSLASTSQTLDSVSTASTVTLNAATKTIAATSDANLTITVKSTGNYYHLLRYKTDNSSAYVNIWTAENVNSTTKTATITPTAILAKFPAAKSGTLTVECWTYTTSSRTTQVGTTQTATCAITITTENFKPTVSLSAIAVAAANSQGSGSITDALVAGYSTAKTTPTVTAGSGTSISSITYVVAPGSFSQTNGTATTGTAITTVAMPASSSNYTLKITVTATDARGQTNSNNVTATVYGYAAPKITTNIYRVASNTATTRDDAGAYVRVAFSAAVSSSINSKNTIQSTTCTASGGVTGTQTTGTWKSLATNKTATFTVTAKDKVSTVTKTVSINTAAFALELYDDKAGTLWAQSGGYFRSIKGGSGDSAGMQVRVSAASTDAAVSVKRTDTGNGIELLVGSDGVNRGLYDRSDSPGWICYYNGTNFIISKPITSLTATGNISTSGAVYAANFYTTNTTANGSVCARMRFSDAATANGTYALIYASYTNTSGRINFRQYSGSSSAITSYYDQFRLPATSAGKTENNTYEILTSKAAVTVAQGGTGVTAAKGSAYNPVYLSSSGIAACNPFTRLRNSEFKAGMDPITFTSAYSKYNYIILVGQPSTVQTTAYASAYIPTLAIGTSDTIFSFANETAGASVKIKRSGTDNADLTITWNASTFSNGRITSIYGGI